MKVSGEVTQQSQDELENHARLKSYAIDLLPRYGHQWNMHSTVMMRRQTLSRILYYQELYQKIVDVPGVICEFGVQWGATMSTLINLRGIYESFNIGRKIVGFDSFEGFLETEGGSSIGDYSTFPGYEKKLEEILTIQESFNPLSHIKKFEIVKGDVVDTVPRWLEDNPEVIMAMVIFDMDLYTPTKSTLEKVIPRLTKGSILVFDELTHPKFPGEMKALQEVFGINKVSLKRSVLQPYGSWFVYEGN